MTFVNLVPALNAGNFFLNKCRIAVAIYHVICYKNPKSEIPAMSYTAEVKARVLDRLIVHLSEVTAAGTEHRERELRRAKIALRTINRMLEEEQKDLETLYGNS